MIPQAAMYSISIEPNRWRVGYHPERDEMFLYYIGPDEIISVFGRYGLDSMGFVEFFDFSKAELLGEL